MPSTSSQNAAGTITHAGQPYNGFVGATLMVFLLPYVEQGAIWNNYVAANSTSFMESTVVQIFICPAEPYAVGQGGYGWSRNIGITFGDYAGNFQVFGVPNGQISCTSGYCSTFLEGMATLGASFPDGTSNTIMLTERNGSNCNGQALLWGDSNGQWRPSFCDTPYPPSSYTPQYAPCPLFQVQPTPSSCNIALASSFHSGGIPTCLADGSACALSPAASAPQPGRPLAIRAMATRWGVIGISVTVAIVFLRKEYSMFSWPTRPVNSRTVAVVACALACVLLAAGCGRGKKYQFHPVKGGVLLGETPITEGTIRFTNPDDPNFVASSPIGPDGTFTLQTSTTSPARTVAGTPEGNYQVIVAMPPVPPSKTFPSMTAPEPYPVVPGSNDLTVKLP